MDLGDLLKVVTAVAGQGEKNANAAWKLAKPLLPFILPLALAQVSAQLRNRDANRTGADDAVADILDAASPVIVGLFTGELKGDAPAVIKTMRALEEIAHTYRVNAGDCEA